MLLTWQIHIYLIRKSFSGITKCNCNWHIGEYLQMLKWKNWQPNLEIIKSQMALSAQDPYLQTCKYPYENYFLIWNYMKLFFLSFAESTIARKFEESEPHQNLGTVYNLVCLLQSVTFTFSDLAWFSPDLVHVHGIVQLQLTTILWESHTCPDDLILQLSESLEICPIHCLNTYSAFQIVHSQFLFY